MAQMVFKRHEIKYQLTNDQRERLERAMRAHMVPDEYGPSTVRNIYFDTPTHLLARRSAEHPLYKEKIRVRSYVPAQDDTPVFLELKKKCDGIVYKRRCTLQLQAAKELLAGTRAAQTQIEREIAFSAQRYEGLQEAMYVAYDREAFYDEHNHEFRMTFDRAVRCRWNDVSLGGSSAGIALMPHDQSLLEVKCAAGMPLWLVDFLSEEGIYKGRFSKYGAAVERQLQSERSRIMPRRPQHAAWLQPETGTRLVGQGTRAAQTLAFA